MHLGAGKAAGNESSDCHNSKPIPLPQAFSKYRKRKQQMVGKHKYDKCPVHSDRLGLPVFIVQRDYSR
jgi:hypothetical protein